MKIGTVALIGRPNTGKSTLVNNLVGQKVAITSPKPQTTQFPIYAVYEDLPAGRQVSKEGVQIIFIDTPGIYIKSGQANRETEKVLSEKVDLILYLVDPTRPRGDEENKVLGMLRKIDTPKILVINKIDKLGFVGGKKTDGYLSQYRFLEDEFDKTVEISALKAKHLSGLVSEILKYLHTGTRVVPREEMAVPALDMTPKQYIEENIREKVYLRLRDELPYAVHVIVDEIKERTNGVTYIKARLLTPARYKKMIIGAGGQKIREIGGMARRELEVSTGKKIYLDLTVEAE